ncbi:hypothetical protein TorRG33x02_357440, partial [Trema orientale]
MRGKAALKRKARSVSAGRFREGGYNKLHGREEKLHASTCLPQSSSTWPTRPSRSSFSGSIWGGGSMDHVTFAIQKPIVRTLLVPAKNWVSGASVEKGFAEIGSVTAAPVAEK